MTTEPEVAAATMVGRKRRAVLGRPFRPSSDVRTSAHVALTSRAAGWFHHDEELRRARSQSAPEAGRRG